MMIANAKNICRTCPGILQLHADRLQRRTHSIMLHKNIWKMPETCRCVYAAVLVDELTRLATAA